MTEWSLSDDDEFDFLDPDDPTAQPSGADGEPPHDQPAARGADPELGEPVSDPAEAVFVWFDDDRRVVRVRVSNRWRERLRATGLPQTLLPLLQRTQLRTGSGFAAPTSDERIEPRRLDTAVIEHLAERTELLDDQSRRLEALPPEQVTASRVVGEKVSGTSDNRMVTVGLDLAGGTRTLDLDEGWLAEARADDIGHAVEQAHADAYSRWQPPTRELGDHARLAQERMLLVREAMAMLQRGAA